MRNLSTKRQRIAELARTKAGAVLSTLHHVIDLEWIREAYRLTRKDGAPGIDGVTAAAYEANLEANLSALLERIKSGRYVAPPVRRVYIPKADGSDRHGAGADLRGGLSVVLVWLPAATIGASGPQCVASGLHGPAGAALGVGRRHL